jgi:hypothetical protein
MSNVAQVPAHIAARIAARQQSGARSSVTAAIVSDGLNIPRISMRGGRYRLVEDGVETTIGTTLDTIIIGANPKVSKVYYDKPYDPAENMHPACVSNDGIAPDANVENPISENCALCPFNVLGSKMLPSGAKSKMCADQRHLAVVPAADPSKVYSLTVPVSGMKGLREYFKELNNYGVGPEEAITELGFDDSVSYPKITFTQKGYVPERSIEKIDAMLDTDAVKVATRQLPPPDAAPALAAPRRTPAIAAPIAVPVDDAYEEEEAVAVQPAKAAKKAAPKVESVKASDELAAKLDSLFDE